MDPPPIDFTDPGRARQRSVFALAQVIEQGLEGTTMISYAHLPEDQRWALAFYVGQLAFPADGAARGEALWRDNAEVRAAIPDLTALVQVRRSEEHTSELQSLMRISYAVFCLKKKIHIKQTTA